MYILAALICLGPVPRNGTGPGTVLFVRWIWHGNDFPSWARKALDSEQHSVVITEDPMPVGDVTLVEDNCRAYLIIDTDTLGVFGHHGDGGYHPVFSTFIDRRNYHHDLR